MAILAVLVVIGIKLWAEDRGVPMPIWKWAVVTCWILAFAVTVAFIGTSLGENEPRAASLGGLIFGTIVVIAGVATWRLMRIGVGSNDS